jgi:hypothetical protein
VKVYTRFCAHLKSKSIDSLRDENVPYNVAEENETQVLWQYTFS